MADGQVWLCLATAEVAHTVERGFRVEVVAYHFAVVADIHHVERVQPVLIFDIDARIDVFEYEYHARLLTTYHSIDAKGCVVEAWVLFHIGKQVHAEFVQSQIHDGDAGVHFFQIDDLILQLFELGTTVTKVAIFVLIDVVVVARGMFQFYGANRTGRWAGRLIQMQNLPQNHLSDLEQARGLVRSGDFDAVELLYEDVPDTFSQLIRTAFIPREGAKFLVSDFSAIEARVIAWLSGETWRQKVFAEGGDIYCASASAMFRVPVEKHGINGHLRQKGKIAELALGYGGSVGALKAMGAIEMGLSEDELPALVDAWRQSNPHIVEFWWAVDRAVMEAVKYKHTTSNHGLTFSCRSGMLFITLPSGRNLAYVKPKVGTNQFGGECITYEGIGSTKKWERLDSYGPKFVENIVQATSRDILCYAMKTLRCCSIVMHIHDELVIEADPRMSLDALCEQMVRTPPWTPGLKLRADGYVTDFYKKD